MVTGVKSRSGSLLMVAILVIIWRKTTANFNLYLTTAEVQRILGVPAELYYIREGVVNDYAMKFSVKVAPEIHTIYFCWEAITRRPVLYNMAVWINTTSTASGLSPIADPFVNISLSGTIPTETETFELNLPCTGLMNGEVEVVLNLNVTSPWPNRPPTVLYFSRKKICLEGIAAEKLLPRKTVDKRKKTVTDRPTASQETDKHTASQDTDEPTASKDTDEPTASQDNDNPGPKPGLPTFAYILIGLVTLAFVVAVIVGVACWKGGSRRKNYPFPAIHSPVFVTASQNERKSTISSQKATPHSQPNIYSSPSIVLDVSPTPSGGYTRTSSVQYGHQSALTGESYASVYKFPFASTNSAHSKLRVTCKCGTDSSCSGIYESSCCSNSNSKSGSHFSSKNSKEEEMCPLKCKFDKCCNGDQTELQGGSPTRIELSDFRERLCQLQMDRERVRLTEIIQEGQMGRMYKGWLQREHPELDQQVLIKTLLDASPAEEVESLCRAGALLCPLRHQNLMSLVGVSFASNSPPFLIYPDPQGRNLKLFLKETPLKVLELAEVCLQAARGLSFMHAMHIPHRDIAARNCLVSDQFQLRITDSALARHFFPEDYETVDKGGTEWGIGTSLLPRRWMAPEVLEDVGRFSYASDLVAIALVAVAEVAQGARIRRAMCVARSLNFLQRDAIFGSWSLGVLLWEASTQGEHPYAGVPGPSLLLHLLTGKRLRQSPTCPDELYRLTTACWSSDPHRRPSAQQALQFLVSFRQTLDAFV